MRTLILGGARSGKSHAAEAMLAGAPIVDYVATGAIASDDDPEWAERVQLHQARRPPNWHTVETTDLVTVLTEDDGPPALVECISTWLAAMMDESGVWAIGLDADAELGRRVNALVAAWATTNRPVIAVSNEVGLGVVPATVSGRRYRDELGRLNLRLAAEADAVYLVVAGLLQRLK